MLYLRYFLVSLIFFPVFCHANDDPLFTPEEIKWIRNHPVVRVTSDPNQKPFDYIEHGVHKGLTSEYLAAISRVSGLRFEMLDRARWSSLSEALVKHDVDMVPSIAAGLQNDEIKKNTILSTPYFVGTMIVATRESKTASFDLDKIAEEVIALKGGGAYERFLRERYPHVRLVATTTTTEALDAVANGQASVTVGLDVTILPLIRRRYRGQLYVAGAIASLPAVVAIGTRKDLPLLASIIDKSLNSLTAREMDMMVDKWIESSDFGAPSWASIARYYALEIAIGLVVLCVLGLLAIRFRIQYQLKAESEARKLRFIAVASHEIRTPLNAIVAAIDLLNRSNLPPLEKQLADTAINASANLLVILDDVLDIAKLDAGKLQLERVASDIHVVAESAVLLMQEQARPKGLPILLNIDAPRHLTVYIDQTRVRQIVVNLISNAIKFTEVGGVWVNVALSVDDDATSNRAQLMLTVRDTGMGIPADRQRSLFEAFEQADASTTRRFGGTGLGLTICKELVTLMGGSIWLESRKGAGTTVSVTIPVEVCETETCAGAKRCAEPEPAPRRYARPVVLVVEDHPVNLQMIGIQLAALHCDATLVGAGQAALDEVERGAYEIVLLDCNLPDLDGYTVARRIRSTRSASLPYLPIVAISAQTSDEHLKRCMESGMDGVLRKPLILKELAAMIDLWCAPADLLVSEPSNDSYGDDLMAGRCLVELFRQTCDEDIRTAREALERDDLPAAKASVHRIKGAAQSLGFGPVAELAQSLEDTLANADNSTDRRAASEKAIRLQQQLTAIDAGRPSAQPPARGMRCTYGQPRSLSAGMTGPAESAGAATPASRQPDARA
ncbi:ATP-binding protein [Burkholderia mayonis]|nr:ATP-binding protein [Burkholderia mayonis]